jgi:hypothetical protein
LYWLDTACFTALPAGFFGNSGTNILTGPGYNNWDLAIEKSAQLQESPSLNCNADSRTPQ